MYLREALRETRTGKRLLAKKIERVRNKIKQGYEKEITRKMEIF